MKHLNRALESVVDLTQQGLVQELPVSPEDGEKILDIIESEQIEQTTSTGLQQAEVALEALYETHGFLRTLGTKADYATQAMAVAHAQAVTKLIGARVPSARTVSLEQFELNKEQELFVALESISEGISAVIEKIKAFLLRIYTWIREKIARFSQNIDKLVKYRAELDVKLSRSSFKDKSPTSAYLRQVIAYRPGNPVKNLLEDARAIDRVFDEFMSHRSRSHAVPFTEPVKRRLLGDKDYDNALKYAEHAAGNAIQAVGATLSGESDNTYRSRNLPGFVSLVIRPPVIKDAPAGPIGQQYILAAPGSISIRRGSDDKLGELPESINSVFARSALDFAAFTIDSFKQVERSLAQFPDIKTHQSSAQRVERDSTAGTPSQGLWKDVYMLQMFYGVWQTQLMSGMLQSSMALLKFVDASLVQDK